MTSCVAVTEVGFLGEGTHGESMKRILDAASNHAVSRRALQVLVTLIAMAHGSAGVVSASVRTSDIDELIELRLIERSEAGDIKLV